MNYAEVLSEQLQQGVDSVWRTVKAMPTEKLDWRPEESARTTRELMEELLNTTIYSIKLVEAQKYPGDDAFPTEAAPKDLAELEKAHRASVEAYLKVLKTFPESKLEEKLDLPWGNSTFFHTLNYPYWNLIYHWGQISYLQTMYGDKETH